METWKPLRDFIIVTAPVVLVYIAGWTYLSSYLNFFHISPSGVKIDVPTVFVYSYGPICGIFSAHYMVIALVGLTYIVVERTNIISILFFRCFGSIQYCNIQSIWFRPLPDQSSFARLVYFIIPITLFLIALVNFVIVPSAEAIAHQDAREKWLAIGQSGILINTIQEQPRPPGASSKALEYFNECQIRSQTDGPMLPIFSDENSLFVLCKSSKSSDYGTVFEIRKDKGVISSETFFKGGWQ